MGNRWPAGTVTWSGMKWWSLRIRVTGRISVTGSAARADAPRDVQGDAQRDAHTGNAANMTARRHMRGLLGTMVDNASYSHFQPGPATIGRLKREMLNERRDAGRPPARLHADPVQPAHRHRQPDVPLCAAAVSLPGKVGAYPGRGGVLRWHRAA